MVQAKHKTDPKKQHENKFSVLMANHLKGHVISKGWFPQEPVGLVFRQYSKIILNGIVHPEMKIAICSPLCRSKAV